MCTSLKENIDYFGLTEFNSMDYEFKKSVHIMF